MVDWKLEDLKFNVLISSQHVNHLTRVGQILPKLLAESKSLKRIFFRFHEDVPNPCHTSFYDFTFNLLSIVLHMSHVQKM